ncbi:uncharacterized protein LOC124816279 [Hydra vulgaris]|uniref:uncharacterized protein LOC124816279 n=1 Tax=Hydra vulgaris TaxID=6087 RepID=UPI001F5F0977|nr:uncharacterized protein LOC124816279 [Hydra vulgaris]
MVISKFEEHKDVLLSKDEKAEINKRRNRIWNKITDAVNSLGFDKRTVTSVKGLWNNLLKNANKEISSTKKIPTEGGPAIILTEISQKILDIYGENSLIFFGLEGVETNSIDFVCDIQNTVNPVVQVPYFHLIVKKTTSNKTAIGTIFQDVTNDKIENSFSGKSTDSQVSLNKTNKINSKNSMNRRSTKEILPKELDSIKNAVKQASFDINKSVLSVLRDRLKPLSNSKENETIIKRTTSYKMTELSAMPQDEATHIFLLNF